MKSISRTLLTLIAVGLIVTVSLAGIATYLSAARSLRDQLDEHLVERAETFAELVVQERGHVQFDFDGDLDEDTIGALLDVVDVTGDFVARSPAWPETMGTRPVLVGSSTRLSSVTVDGEPARMVTMTHEASIDPDEPQVWAAPPAMVQTRVIVRTASVDETIASVGQSLLLGGVIAVVGSLLCVWFGVRRGLTPLSRVRDGLASVDAQRIEPIEWSPEPPIELRPITAAVNDVLRRLKHAMERERRFTDAAAHELRTPIAELRSLTDVASKWPDGERQRAAIAEAQSIAKEMEAIVECLLDAARGQTNEESVEPVALGLVVEKELSRASARAEARGLSLGMSCVNGASWTAPLAAVERIVRNLVDNSIEYTCPGGSIEVDITEQRGRTTMRIQNGPVSLSPEDAASAFEPFWRSDKSRESRSHVGMGLTIVDTLARSIGVEREVEVTPEQAFRVTLMQSRH